MSKYKAEWKAFELNKEFWDEVLVNRVITNWEPFKRTVGTDDEVKVDCIRMTLDSGEAVVLDNDHEYVTEPGPHLENLSPTGSKIIGLVYDDDGIASLALEGGTKIDLAPKFWRLYINDLSSIGTKGPNLESQP